MLNPDFLKTVFLEKALPYADYLNTGTPEQKQRWTQVYQAAVLSQPQTELLRSFIRQMNILVVIGLWCGDCVQQCPLLARIAEASPRLTLHFLDRDAVPQLRDTIAINAGHRVPTVLFLAEDFSFCGLYGDRSLTRYRAVTRQQLGPACPTGLFLPDGQELQATLQDWLNEVERIQLMLRLSTRLRQLHKD